MNQSNDLARSPHAIVLVSVQKHLPPTRPRNIRLHLLELARAALLLDLQRRLGDFVAEQPAGVLPPAQHEVGVCLLRIDNRLLDVVVDGRLDGAHEARAHVDALCAQGQRGREALAVGKPAARDEGNAEALARPAQEDEVRDVVLADVAGALEPVDREEVDAEFDGGLGVADRRALVQDDRVVLLEHLDYGAGRVAGGFDDADAFVDHDLGVLGVWGWVDGGEEGDVYAEGVFGHGFGFADLFAEVFGGWLGQGCELRVVSEWFSG